MGQVCEVGRHLLQLDGRVARGELSGQGPC